MNASRSSLALRSPRPRAGGPGSGPGTALNEQRLVAADGSSQDVFGHAVAIDGDVAAVGAPENNLGRGAVYTYLRSGNAWVQTGKLTASDGATSDRLGSSVAIFGDTIVAGANGDDIGLNGEQGSVYTFSRTGAANRTQTAKLTVSDGAASDFFGFSVAIDANVIVAGAPNDDPEDHQHQPGRRLHLQLSRRQPDRVRQAHGLRRRAPRRAGPVRGGRRRRGRGGFAPEPTTSVPSTPSRRPGPVPSPRPGSWLLPTRRLTTGWAVGRDRRQCHRRRRLLRRRGWSSRTRGRSTPSRRPGPAPESRPPSSPPPTARQRPARLFDVDLGERDRRGREPG